MDIKIGNLIFKAISKEFPDDSIESEDGPHKKKGSSKYVWYVDPLDGTTNYVHRYPAYATCISCIDQEISAFLASGVYIPAFNLLFTAYGEKGSYLNQKKIKTSVQRQLKNALILSGLSFRVKKNSQEMKTFINLSTSTAGTRRSGCAAIDLCYVAAGYADGYYHYNLKPWDMAAGYHLLINAGGKVSNIGKNELFDLSEGTIIASNGLIHSELINDLIA